MADWTDKVAIVSRTSRGIGRAIARALAARGAAICINYATRVAEAEARGSLAWKIVAPLGTTIGPAVRVGCVRIIAPPLCPSVQPR